MAPIRAMDYLSPDPMSPAAARPGETSVSRAVSLEALRCPACRAVLSEVPRAWQCRIIMLAARSAASGKGEVRRCWRHRCNRWLEIFVQPRAAA